MADDNENIRVPFEIESGAEITLQAPLVHLNGSGGKSLVEDFLTATRAVRAASEALAKITPHGRDYYPLGDDALITARAQHAVRTTHLNRIERELTTLAVAVQKQMDERRKP